MQIAAECSISYHTVDVTLRHTRARLGATNIPHAVVLAIALELISLDPDGNVSVPDKFNYLAA